MTSVETVLWYPFNLLSNGPMIFPGTCPTQAVNNKDKRRIGLLASRISMFYCQVLKLLLLEEVIVITL